ncbi:MAG: hypothetical protein KatS3mg013_0961 [Actinomycetota bacterium]|nr:MAG: hypothetical protein KatS3mg013_0961 [Actinomycetota bacterium]
MRRLLPVALSIALAAVACGGEPSPPGPGAPSPRPSTRALLRIEEPRNGEVIRGDRVRIVLSLSGARLAETARTEVRPDEGHLHVMLDDRLLSMTGRLEQVIRDVEPGEHLLRVEFVANDHAPFDPRVIQAVTFEVRR